MGNVIEQGYVLDKTVNLPQSLLNIKNTKSLCVFYTEHNEQNYAYFNRFLAPYKITFHYTDCKIAYIKISQMLNNYLIFYALFGTAISEFLLAICHNYTFVDNRIITGDYRFRRFDSIKLKQIREMKNFNVIFFKEYISYALKLTGNADLYEFIYKDNNLLEEYNTNRQMFVYMLYNYIEMKYQYCLKKGHYIYDDIISDMDFVKEITPLTLRMCEIEDRIRQKMYVDRPIRPKTKKVS